MSHETWWDLTWQPEVPKAKTVIDVYRRIPTIPDGYEVVGFRLPKLGEYLLPGSPGYMMWATSDHTDGCPFLILRRWKPRKVVFTEVRRERVEEGEYYAYTFNRHIFTAPQGGFFHKDLIAFRREDTEE